MNDISGMALFMVSCLFAQNFVFGRLLGSSTVFQKTGTLGAAAFTGVFMTVVTTIAAAGNWLIMQYILVPQKAESLYLIVSVLVLMAAAMLTGTVMKKCSEKAGEILGEDFPLLAANCLVLGASLLGRGEGFGTAVMWGLFGGLGFLLAIVLMAGVQERLETSRIPAAMKGLPISLVSASLIALAFAGFLGL